MTNKDLLKQYVSSGNQLNEYQLNKLNDNLLKTYFNIRLRDKLEGYELIKLYDLDKILSNKYINNIDDEEIIVLLAYSTEPNKLFDILGKRNKDFINKLTVINFKYLIEKSNYPGKIFYLLGNEGKSLINQLEYNDILDILYFSYNKNDENLDEILKILSNNNTFNNKLHNILSWANDKYLNSRNNKAFDYYHMLINKIKTIY